MCCAICRNMIRAVGQKNSKQGRLQCADVVYGPVQKMRLSIFNNGQKRKSHNQQQPRDHKTTTPLQKKQKISRSKKQIEIRKSH